MLRFKRTRCCASLVAGLSLMGLVGLTSNPVLAAPEAAYEVAEVHENYEIRRYADAVLALVTTTGSRDDASGVAFRKLFRYISGENRADAEISMTTPVLQGREIAPGVASLHGSDTATWQVAFVMPEGFDLQATPEAEDPDIQIVPFPGRVLAVIRFSGFWSDENFREHEASLRASLQAAGRKTRGPALFAYYNPPFMPWFMRRNEVMLELVDAGEGR